MKTEPRNKATHAPSKDSTHKKEWESKYNKVFDTKNQLQIIIKKNKLVLSFVVKSQDQTQGYHTTKEIKETTKSMINSEVQTGALDSSQITIKNEQRTRVKMGEFKIHILHGLRGLNRKLVQRAQVQGFENKTRLQ